MALHKKSESRHSEEKKRYRPIKQILLAAGVNQDYFANFKQRGIDFNMFIEMTAEDLALIGIKTDEEINALLKCTQSLVGLNSNFTDSPTFDLNSSIEDTMLAIQRIHCELINMKRFLFKELDNDLSSQISNPILEPEQAASSVCLNFLNIITEGLSIAEDNYQAVLDALEENKSIKERSRYCLIFGVVSTIFITVTISAFLFKKWLR